MKKVYTKPALEVTVLDMVDMICTSAPDLHRGEGANRDFGNLSRDRFDEDDDW